MNMAMVVNKNIKYRVIYSITKLIDIWNNQLDNETIFIYNYFAINNKISELVIQLHDYNCINNYIVVSNKIFESIIQLHDYKSKEIIINTIIKVKYFAINYIEYNIIILILILK